MRYPNRKEKKGPAWFSRRDESTTTTRRDGAEAMETIMPRDLRS